MKSSQSNDTPNGEEAYDHDNDAGRGIADGVYEGSVAITALGLATGEVRFLAQEDQVGDGAREDEHAQSGQGN